MALGIKTAEANNPACTLAGLTDETTTDSITAALRERLARERARREAQTDLPHCLTALSTQLRAAYDTIPISQQDWGAAAGNETRSSTNPPVSRQARRKAGAMKKSHTTEPSIFTGTQKDKLASLAGQPAPQIPGGARSRSATSQAFLPSPQGCYLPTSGRRHLHASIGSALSVVGKLGGPTPNGRFPNRSGVLWLRGLCSGEGRWLGGSAIVRR
jgi:hypothetical protein